MCLAEVSFLIFNLSFFNLLFRWLWSKSGDTSFARLTITWHLHWYFSLARTRCRIECNLRVLEECERSHLPVESWSNYPQLHRFSINFPALSASIATKAAARTVAVHAFDRMSANRFPQISPLVCHATHLSLPRSCVFHACTSFQSLLQDERRVNIGSQNVQGNTWEY